MQFRQKLANFAVFCARHFFDRITSYNLENMNERKWLRRILFLETVAGSLFVPSMGGLLGGVCMCGGWEGGGGGVGRACVPEACHCLASPLPVCLYM